jgi:DNA-binding NarL/FixJ family response regulator
MNGGSLDRGPLQPLKKSITAKSKLLTALVESVLLRFVGFRTLLESELDIEVISASLTEIGLQANIDLALVGDGPGQNLFATIPNLKVMRPDLSVIITGSSADDKIMLNAIVCGTSRYVFDGSPPSEFARAIRTLSQGSKAPFGLRGECFRCS